MVHDFELLNWIGANSFRTSHYPYAEEVLDYADRHGIVVIDEIAAVGLNTGHRRRDLRRPNRSHLLATTPSATPPGGPRQAIRELVARDKNHPSVVLWSIANEPEPTPPEARDYFAPLVDLTRAPGPHAAGRVRQLHAGPGRSCEVSRTSLDVCMINRYYGWYVQPGDLAAAERALEAELASGRRTASRSSSPSTAPTPSPACTASSPRRRGPRSTRPSILDMSHRVFDRVDAVVGEQVWNFADFATRSGIFRVDGNKKGVFTRDRRPKASAWALRRRWTEKGEPPLS